jgi:tyrosinase
MLSAEKNYSMFSNVVVGDRNSVENLHNTIHLSVGGNGHMAYIPMSSFDPIFWIHHA